jgi:hypothetical protein
LLGEGLLGCTMSEQRLDRIIRCRGMSRRQWLISVGKRVKQCCCMVQLLVRQVINARMEIVASRRHLRSVRSVSM